MAKKNKDLTQNNTAETETTSTLKTEDKNNKKKDKILSPKQVEKKLASKKEGLRQQHYKSRFEQETDLARKQFTERRRIKKSIIKNGVIFLIGIGIGVALMLLVNQLLILVSLPIAAVTIFNIIRVILLLKKLKNPYQVREIIILEEAKKKHIERNKMIMDAYHKEKKRIKMLKRLPYKVLASTSFLITMLAIILFFFVLDVGIEATALIVFSIFTLTYFVVGLIMIAVFYMVSENKQREMMLRLEAEKNRLLAEEKLRADAAVRNKLAAERRKYEEEERLRLEEQFRISKEESEMQQRIEEEKQLLEIIEEEKKKLIKETRITQQDIVQPLSKAEIKKEIESIRNDFDRKILKEIDNNLDKIDIGGIENFSDSNKIKTEYAAGAIFPDVSDSDADIKNEFDNAIFNTINKDDVDLDNSIVNFDTTDIEEAKKIIFENAKHQAQTPPKEKSVSGKNIMAIKQMLKDG